MAVHTMLSRKPLIAKGILGHLHSKATLEMSIKAHEFIKRENYLWSSTKGSKIMPVFGNCFSSAVCRKVGDK